MSAERINRADLVMMLESLRKAAADAGITSVELRGAVDRAARKAA